MRHLLSFALAVQLLLPAAVGRATAAQGPVGSAALTANDLLRECTLSLRYLDGDRTLANEEFVYGAHCMGYLVGFYEGYDAKAHFDKVMGDPSHREVCFPENVPNDQMVRIVVKFLREHPERLQQAPTLLVMAAFNGAFPCK